MFKLKNKEGNAIRHAASKVKRDQLVSLGYVDVTPVPEEQDVEDTVPEDEGTAPEDEQPKAAPRRNNGSGRRKNNEAKKTDEE